MEKEEKAELKAGMKKVEMKAKKKIEVKTGKENKKGESKKGMKKVWTNNIKA